MKAKFLSLFKKDKKKEEKKKEDPPKAQSPKASQKLQNPYSSKNQ